MQHPGILEGDGLASLRRSEPDSAHWAASRGLLQKWAQPSRSETSPGELAPCFLTSISEFPFLGSFDPCLLTSRSAAEQREGIWSCNHKMVVMWGGGGRAKQDLNPLRSNKECNWKEILREHPPCAVCPRIYSWVPQHAPITLPWAAAVLNAGPGKVPPADQTLTS